MLLQGFVAIYLFVAVDEQAPAGTLRMYSTVDTCSDSAHFLRWGCCLLFLQLASRQLWEIIDAGMWLGMFKWGCWSWDSLHLGVSHRAYPRVAARQTRMPHCEDATAQPDL